MNSQKLFINIHQAINFGSSHTNIPNKAEYERELVVHIARNSPTGQITHITAEYAGNRPKFLIVAALDGFSEYGASLHGFIMPRLKLDPYQRALIAMSLFQYLCDNDRIDAEFATYKERFISEVAGGVNTLDDIYDRTCRVSDYILAGHTNYDQLSFN